MSKRNIPVSDGVKNIISNLKSADPRLKDIEDWRIDSAHRQYAVSEDFGDDTKVFEWLPDDTDDDLLTYIQGVQIPDLKRTIHEHEEYILKLQKRLNMANSKLPDNEKV